MYIETFGGVTHSCALWLTVPLAFSSAEPTAIYLPNLSPLSNLPPRGSLYDFWLILYSSGGNEYDLRVRNGKLVFRPLNISNIPASSWMQVCWLCPSRSQIVYLCAQCKTINYNHHNLSECRFQPHRSLWVASVDRLLCCSTSPSSSSIAINESAVTRIVKPLCAVRSATDSRLAGGTDVLSERSCSPVARCCVLCLDNPLDLHGLQYMCFLYISLSKRRYYNRQPENPFFR